MKTDQLEKFVKDNREAFDALEPDPLLWEKVSNNLPLENEFRWQRFFVRASAVAAIFIAGYFFSVYTYQKSGSNQQLSATESEYAEMIEAKVYYTRQIEQHRTAIDQLTKDQPFIREEISQEFERMEKSMQELQLDLDDEVSGELVVEAMIQHYRLKLELLEDILQQLQTSTDETQKEVNHVY